VNLPGFVASARCRPAAPTYPWHHSSSFEFPSHNTWQLRIWGWPCHKTEMKVERCEIKSATGGLVTVSIAQYKQPPLLGRPAEPTPCQQHYHGSFSRKERTENSSSWGDGAIPKVWDMRKIDQTRSFQIRIEWDMDELERVRPVGRTVLQALFTLSHSLGCSWPLAVLLEGGGEAWTAVVKCP